MLEKNLKLSIEAILNSDKKIIGQPGLHEILQFAEMLNTLSALAESQQVKLLKNALEHYPQNMWPPYHLANYYVLRNSAIAKKFASKTIENYNAEEDFGGTIYSEMSEIIKQLAE